MFLLEARAFSPSFQLPPPLPLRLQTLIVFISQDLSLSAKIVYCWQFPLTGIPTEIPSLTKYNTRNQQTFRHINIEVAGKDIDRDSGWAGLIFKYYLNFCNFSQRKKIFVFVSFIN